VSAIVNSSFKLAGGFTAASFDLRRMMVPGIQPWVQFPRGAGVNEQMFGAE
jgi:hypothetical protein